MLGARTYGIKLESLDVLASQAPHTALNYHAVAECRMRIRCIEVSSSWKIFLASGRPEAELLGNC